jgi:hypothetical protein
MKPRALSTSGKHSTVRSLAFLGRWKVLRLALKSDPWLWPLASPLLFPLLCSEAGLNPNLGSYQSDEWGSSLPLLPVLCLLKPIAHILYPEDGWRWAECLLCHFPWHVPGCVTNLLSLPFALSLYLAYRGEWLDLKCRISGVWALGPNLRFHLESSCSPRLLSSSLEVLPHHPNFLHCRVYASLPRFFLFFNLSLGDFIQTHGSLTDLNNTYKVPGSQDLVFQCLMSTLNSTCPEVTWSLPPNLFLLPDRAGFYNLVLSVI